MIRFTKDEKIALLFLAAALFIGTTVLYHKKLAPRAYQIIEFDEKEIEESKKVNINKATEEELVEIKHIGPALARRIITYRDKYGPFKKTEDIKSIKGIGEKTYEKIRKGITLE